MKPNGRSILSRLDNTLRWTGIPAQVADEMSNDPSVDRKHRPLRWIPIWPIAVSCTLFILFLAWPSALDRVSLGVIVAVLISLGSGIGALTLVIHTNGPLGKPSCEDDEREAALRKDSFLFCLGLLACLSGLGQPFVLILSHVQNWRSAQTMSVAMSALMLNVILLGCLPTLYASWGLRQLPKE
jgi:nitrate reductase gamma subunit